MVAPEPRYRDLTVSAPAKINLVLKILDRRGDGYHNLWSLMHAIDLEDELQFRVNGRVEGGQEGFNLEIPSGGLPSDHRNLVSRAVALLGKEAIPVAGMTVTLRKRIPVGAGLGGGSSDAAATLIGLNHLLGTRRSTADLMAMGADLGSDVPFFFLAPSAVVRGRGDVVQRVELTGKRWFVLVYPGFPIQTSSAYARLAATRPSSGMVPDALDERLARGALGWEEVLAFLENDFETVLLRDYPDLGRIKFALLDAGAEQALVSGSGSTVFGVFADPGAAQQARERLVNQGPSWHVFAVGSGSGVRLSEGVATGE